MTTRYNHRNVRISTLIEQSRGVNGVIAVPDIQRPFVWAKSEVQSLLASVLAGVPIGSMLFGRGTEPGDQAVMGGKARLPGAVAAPHPTNRWRVLDGRQRLTALSSGFQRFRQGRASAFLAAQPVWFLKLDAVLDEPSMLESAVALEQLLVLRRFKSAGRSEGTARLMEKQLSEPLVGPPSEATSLLLPLPWLMAFAMAKPDQSDRDAERLGSFRQRIAGRAGDEVLRRLTERITEHSVPVTILEGEDEEYERQSFVRLNTTGIRLSDLDLELAHHGLRADLDALTALNATFEDIQHGQMLEVLFSMHPHLPRPDHLNPDASRPGVPIDARTLADSNVRELRKRIREFNAETMKDRAKIFLAESGLCSLDDSPVEEVTQAALAVMAELLSGRSELDQKLHLGLTALGIQAWWWARSAQSISSDGRPKAGELMADLRMCLEGGFAGWNDSLIPDCSSILDGPATGRRRELLFALLRSLRLPDLEYGGEYDLRTHARSWDLHHIFPRAYLKRLLLKGEWRLIDHCANLTLTSSDTNRGVLGSKAPSQVLEELAGSAEHAVGANRSYLLERHGICLDACASNDFPALLDARRRWLHNCLLEKMTITGAPGR